MALYSAQTPYFGGIWDAEIKSIKFHLKRVIGAKGFTCEEFYIIITQIEAVINSRSLWFRRSHPTDPWRFLIDRSFILLPERDLVISASTVLHSGNNGVIQMIDIKLRNKTLTLGVCSSYWWLKDLNFSKAVTCYSSRIHREQYICLSACVPDRVVW